jgi:hypothetical protein
LQSPASFTSNENQFSQTMWELATSLLAKSQGRVPDHLSKEALVLANWFAQPDAPAITKIKTVREMYKAFSHQTKTGVLLHQFALSIKKLYDEGHPHGIFVYKGLVEDGLIVVIERLEIDPRPYSERLM